MPPSSAMFIEEICIEGFKSYAQRTVVPNFDPCFNAITGLNGTGKSNILDSICFVLGITNLSQARARLLWAAQRAPRHGCRFERQSSSPALPPPAPLFSPASPPPGSRGQPAGAGVQAGPGGRDQGLRLHRLQQQRRLTQPRRLRALRDDQRHAAGHHWWPQ